MNEDDKIIIETPVIEEEALETPEYKEKEEHPSLEKIIKEQATEDESPQSSSFKLSRILVGDILNTSAVRHQIWVLLIITAFLIVYISNRYSCQQSLIEIDKLQKELKDAKFRALSSNSMLTEKSRESNVLEMLKANKDSLLHHADQPPYIINVKE